MTNDQTPSAAVGMWDLVSDAVIPASAIVISTLLAVLLFRAERSSSRRAVQQDRQDRLLEEMIATLAFFVSVNPLAESWSAEFRRLRAQVTILQTLPSPSARLLGEWMVLEAARGKADMVKAMVELQFADEATDHLAAQLIKPAHDWAAYCINSIASWMRGDIGDIRVQERIDELQSAATVSPPDA